SNPEYTSRFSLSSSMNLTAPNAKKTTIKRRIPLLKAASPKSKAKPARKTENNNIESKTAARVLSIPPATFAIIVPVIKAEENSTSGRFLIVSTCRMLICALFIFYIFTYLTSIYNSNLLYFVIFARWKNTGSKE
ncbi:MAG: hypothetical protein HGA22_12040, partial [Clostridiales bacterium]|nr:hypothetical protein [Clostridiales bacterium]